MIASRIADKSFQPETMIFTLKPSHPIPIWCEWRHYLEVFLTVEAKGLLYNSMGSRRSAWSAAGLKGRRLADALPLSDRENVIYLDISGYTWWKWLELETHHEYIQCMYIGLGHSSLGGTSIAAFDNPQRLWAVDYFSMTWQPSSMAALWLAKKDKTYPTYPST